MPSTEAGGVDTLSYPQLLHTVRDMAGPAEAWLPRASFCCFTASRTLLPMSNSIGAGPALALTRQACITGAGCALLLLLLGMMAEAGPARDLAP